MSGLEQRKWSSECRLCPLNNTFSQPGGTVMGYGLDAMLPLVSEINTHRCHSLQLNCDSNDTMPKVIVIYTTVLSIS